MSRVLEESDSELLLKDYTFDLPEERIAKYPLEQRDQSKLLVYKQGVCRHTHFYELSKELPESAFLVFNDTKVIPARAHFRKSTGATIEILFLQPELPSRNIQEAMLIKKSSVWQCMVGNKKRWKAGESLETELIVEESKVNVKVTYVDYEQNHISIEWSDETYTFLDIISALGSIPLPPYLNRDTEESDVETYQTVYAKNKGAVAAPTAGLHFTPAVFSQLAAKGILHDFLTLHVGAGTFQPIKVEAIADHTMHKEQVVYTRRLIENLIKNEQGIVAVGTTSLRSLESLYWFGFKLLKEGKKARFQIEKSLPYTYPVEEHPSASEVLTAVLEYMEEHFLDELWGETGIFIYPGYDFKIVKGLITNYHQPGSTLVLLIAAFTKNNWRTIYQEAFENDYRFLSYGDSSLLWLS
jgi:S-adenosylmethionine:tRNA ribosyltransferase-isomerase